MNSFFCSRTTILLTYFFISLFLLKDIFFIEGNLMAGDWNLPATAIQAKIATENFSSSWTTMGNLFGVKQVSLTLAPFNWLISVLNINGWVVGARLLLVFLFTFAGYSFFLFSRFIKVKPLASLLGSLFYLTTPIFFNYAIMGWIFVLFFLGLIPLVAMLFIKSHQEKRLSLSLWVGILYALAMFQSQSIFWFMLLFLILGFYLIRNKRDFFFYVKQLGLIIITFVLLSSYWLLDILLVPNANVSGSDILNSQISLGILGHFIPLNTVRLFGPLYNFQYETVLDNYNLGYFSLLIPIFVLGSFFLREEKRLVITFWLVALVPFSMCLLNFWRDLLVYIPFSNVIRDFARFTVFSSFAYAVLFSLIINRLMKGRRIWERGSFALGCALLVLMTFPWWRGELTNWPHSLGSDMRLRAKAYSDNYYQLENDLAKKKLDQKAIFFPIGGILDFEDDPKYHGLFNEAQDIFAGYSSVPGVLVISDRSQGRLAEYFKALISDYENIAGNIQLTSANYIVIRKNTSFDGKEEIIRTLEKEDSFEKYFDSKDLVVFVRNEKMPHFYIADKSFFSRRELDQLQRIVAEENYFFRTAIFFEFQNEKNKSNLDLIELTGSQGSAFLEYKKINSTKYRVRVHGAREKFPLVFSESFHQGWHLYFSEKNKGEMTNSKIKDPNKSQITNSKLLSQLNDYKILDGNEADQATKEELEEYVEKGWVTPNDFSKGKLEGVKEKEIRHMKWNEEKQREELDYIEKYKIDFVSKNFQGTIQNDNLPKGNIFETWLSKSQKSNLKNQNEKSKLKRLFQFNKNSLQLSEERHLMVNGYANSWVIDPEEICREEVENGGRDESYCIKNDDGSYDMELVVEFWPQRLFYIGLAVSLTTLFGCLGYLGFDFYRRRKLEAARPNDSIEGARPGDEIERARPNDGIEGARPSDKIEGASPNDEIEEASPNDEIERARPNDEIEGAGPGDKIEGASPNNKIEGASPNNKIEGG